MDHYWGIPLTLFYLFLFLLIIRKWCFFTDDSLTKKHFTLFFLYKLMMGLALTAIYTFYYTDTSQADIYKYYTDSYHMTRALWEHPTDFFKMLFGIGNDTQHFTDEYYSKMNFWFRIFDTQIYNDNHTIIRYNALVRVFSFGYFHIHTLCMSFLSFFGMVCFYKGFKLFLPTPKHLYLAYGLFLFPSLTFWSAGNLKEGILIFTLGSIFLFWCTLLVKKRFYKWYFLLACFSAFISLYLKTYSLVIMSMGLACLSVGFLAGNKRLTLVYLCCIILGIGLMTILSYAVPNYSIPSILLQKHDDFLRMSIDLKAGSTFTIGAIEDNWLSLVKMSPIAFYSGLFRPTFLDAGNPVMLMAATESFLIMGALFLALFFGTKINHQQLNMLFCCALITVLLSTLIGLTTANFGSLVRYKVPMLPFIVFVCVCLLNFEKLQTALRLKK